MIQALWLTIVYLLVLCTSASAQLTLPAPIPIQQPGGAILETWLNDGQETTPDGGRNWYVAAGGGGSSCTRAQPCALSTALGSDSGGDNILLRCGDTFGHIALNNAPNGSSSNQTVFGAWGNCGGGRPIVDSNGASHNMTNKSYIWVERIHFRDNGPFRVWEGSHHITFFYITLENFPLTCFNIDDRPNQGAAPHHVTIARSNIDGCGQSHEPCPNGADGDEALYISPNSSNKTTATDIHAYNNRISDTTKEPVNIKDGAHRIRIQYNLFEDVGICNDAGAISTNFEDQSEIIVEGNIFRNIEKLQDNMPLFNFGEAMIARNNLVYNMKSSVCMIMLNSASSPNTHVYHNTFAQFSGSAICGGSKASLNGNIRNNIGPGSLADNINTSTSLYENPGARDYRLKSGVSAINAHSNCRGVTTDILGASRPASGSANCDTGAFEFNGSAPPPPPPPGGEKFVSTSGNDSTGTGSSTAPWRTIQHCVNQMAAAGSTCTIRQGTYAENIVVANKIGTSFSNAYTIRAAPDSTVTIRPPGGANVILLTDNSAFVVIDAASANAHMIIDGANVTNDCILATGHLGPTGSSADFSRIHQLEIRNCPAAGSAIGGVAGTRGMEYLQNHIHNNNGPGIYVAGRENIIAANDITDNGGIGIWLTADGTSNANSARVYNNDIERNASTGIRLDFSANSSIYNNEIVGNGGGIWLVDADSSGTALDFNSVANNTAHGIRHTGATGTRIGSNAVFGNTTGQIFVESGTPTLLTNLETDPLWVDAPAGDLRLKGGSPALNAGTCITTITTDKAGNPRPAPDNPACDIGAHEGASTPPPIGGERFVSTTGSNTTGTGSITAPWRTIQFCHDQIQATGSTCTIRGGTYTENVTITKIGSSFVDGYLFRVHGNETAIIQPTSGTHVLRITDNAAYVQVSATQAGAHLILDGTSVTGDVLRIDGQAGSTGSAADNLRVWDVEIRNGPAHCLQTLAGTTDLDLQLIYAHDCDFTGMTLRGSDNLVAANDIKNNGTSGLWLASDGVSDASRARVFANEIEGNGASGIFVDIGTQIAIFNNEIANNGVNGITLEDDTVDGAAVRFNSVANNTGYGIRHAGATSTTLGSNAVFGNGSGQIFVEAGTPNLQTNLQTDPLWMDATTGDLRLKETSPALNAGTCAATISTDFAGLARPGVDDPRCDIGAHEGFVPGTGPPPQVENAQFRIMGGRFMGGRLR